MKDRAIGPNRRSVAQAPHGLSELQKPRAQKIMKIHEKDLFRKIPERKERDGKSLKSPKSKIRFCSYQANPPPRIVATKLHLLRSNLRVHQNQQKVKIRMMMMMMIMSPLRREFLQINHQGVCLLAKSQSLLLSPLLLAKRWHHLQQPFLLRKS